MFSCGQSLRKEFEVTNEMLIFKSFRVSQVLYYWLSLYTRPLSKTKELLSFT